MALDPKTCQEIIRRTLEMWEEKAANDASYKARMKHSPQSTWSGICR